MINSYKLLLERTTLNDFDRISYISVLARIDLIVCRYLGPMNDSNGLKHLAELKQELPGWLVEQVDKDLEGMEGS